MALELELNQQITLLSLLHEGYPPLKAPLPTRSFCYFPSSCGGLSSGVFTADRKGLTRFEKMYPDVKGLGRRGSLALRHALVALGKAPVGEMMAGASGTVAGLRQPSVGGEGSAQVNDDHDPDHDDGASQGMMSDHEHEGFGAHDGDVQGDAAQPSHVDVAETPLDVGTEQYYEYRNMGPDVDKVT